MPLDMSHIDPRVRRWFAHNEEQNKAFLRRVFSRSEEGGKRILGLLRRQAGQPSGEKGRKRPRPTWESLAAARAELARELRESMERVGVWQEWRRVQTGAYDEAISRLSPGLTVSEHRATGVDGNPIPLCFIRPAGTERVPCVYYIHGGGMAALSSRDGTFQSWGRLVARQGVAVCLVEFRNSLEPTEAVPNVAPYPAGLNDCYSGLQWLHANASGLGISDDVCVAGESGGGNLCIAVALKAKREGQLHLLRSGIFAMCPYIAGLWPQDVRNEGILGVSHVENGPMPGGGSLTTATGYSISAFEARDPLAWPGFATVEDLVGLPRIVISVNEGDIFRDEGVVFYRRCLAAGVSAQCRNVMGTLHASDLAWHMVPDVALGSARALADFAAYERPLRRLDMPPEMPLPPPPAEKKPRL